MATAGKQIVGTELPREEHAQLSRECAAAGISISEHLKRCLKFGERLLRLEADAKRQAD